MRTAGGRIRFESVRHDDLQSTLLCESYRARWTGKGQGPACLYHHGRRDSARTGPEDRQKIQACEDPAGEFKTFRSPSEVYLRDSQFRAEPELGGHTDARGRIWP